MLPGDGPRHAKSSAAGSTEPGAGGSNGRAGELDREQYWLDTWAFGTSRYGLGLDGTTLWCLTPREHLALVKQWEDSRELPLQIHAAIQATLHNTAGKTYKEHFTAEMFMPGYKKKPQGLAEKMAIAAALFRRQVKCPDCGELVKAREVHSCHGSPISA